MVGLSLGMGTGVGEPYLTHTVPLASPCLTQALRYHQTDSIDSIPETGLSRHPALRQTDSRVLTLAEVRSSDLTFLESPAMPVPDLSL